MLYLNATSLNFVEKGNMKNNFSVIQKGNSLVIYTEEYKSKNRHNVGWFFEGVLYFGWPNQPSSLYNGKFYIRTCFYEADIYVNTQKQLIV